MKKTITKKQYGGFHRWENEELIIESVNNRFDKIFSNEGKLSIDNLNNKQFEKVSESLLKAKVISRISHAKCPPEMWKVEEEFIKIEAIGKFSLEGEKFLFSLYTEEKAGGLVDWNTQLVDSHAIISYNKKYVGSDYHFIFRLKEEIEFEKGDRRFQIFNLNLSKDFDKKILQIKRSKRLSKQPLYEALKENHISKKNQKEVVVCDLKCIDRDYNITVVEAGYTCEYYKTNEILRVKPWGDPLEEDIDLAIEIYVEEIFAKIIKNMYESRK